MILIITITPCRPVTSGHYYLSSLDPPLPRKNGRSKKICQTNQKMIHCVPNMYVSGKISALRLGTQTVMIFGTKPNPKTTWNNEISGFAVFFLGGGVFFFRGFLHSRLMRCKHFLAFVSPSPKTSRRDDYRPAFSIKSGWRCGNLAFFLSKSGSKKRSGFVCVCNPSSILCLKTRRIRLALFLPSHSLLRLSPVFCSKAVESFSHLQWVGRTYCHRAGFARLLIWDLRESGALSSRESTRSQCLQCGFWYSHPLPPHPTPHPTRFPKKFTPSFVQYF